MKRLLYILAIVMAVGGSFQSYGNEYHYELSLQGNWKFSIGDNHEWSQRLYNDDTWSEIKVPARWEDEGYRGYDGFAWYRKYVRVPSVFKDRNVYLELGYVDDVDEVYFNGEKIGQTGTFPPDYETAYNSFRKYVVPHYLINIYGENTIAVRTYDAQLEGGIVRGEVRLVAGDIAVIPEISLNGYWNFELGRTAGDSHKIMVPGEWENQGFFNYDGYAVYSKTVNIPEELANKKLIFLAGRIDDDDRFYINGELIAQTGNYDGGANAEMYTEFRNYFIPENVIQPGENTVTIKVYDRMGEGGILEGNVGFITQEKFIEYWNMKRKN
ncbi:MAG: glycoside hydrolase [Prolixibacteraceae bacterium]|nr:glycoside hydrolase [Prolixibacteraceae bacterium]